MSGRREPTAAAGWVSRRAGPSRRRAPARGDRPGRRTRQAVEVAVISASRRGRATTGRSRRTQPSTISAKMRSPSAAVAVVGSPSTPTALTAATPAAAHRRQQLGQRRARCRRASGRSGRRPAKYAATPMFRCARRGRRRRRRCTSTTRRRGPRRAAGHRAGQRVDVAAVAVDEDQARWPSRRADRPYSTSSIVSASVPIETVPAKP